MCKCEPEVNSMNHACPQCQEEFEAWCQVLERSGIIGPYEEHARAILQRAAVRRAELEEEADANARYYAAMGEF